MEKNLGHATAYGYAKSKGYSGTEEEFAELMADYASVGQSAAQSAEQAAASATSASGSAATAASAAQTATSKASEAVTAADTATTKASEASTSADTASAAATSAGTSAQTATTAASTATTKASEAAVSANTATTAKTDAETARDAAAQSASEAAESARTLTIDATLSQSGQAADAKAVGDEIDSLKSTFDNSLIGIDKFSNYAQFEHYGLNSIGEYATNQQYRVSCVQHIKFNRTIKINVKSGFRWGYRPFVNGEMGAWVGWITTEKLIQEGTEFIVQIARVTENTSEIADVDEFVSAIVFETAIGERLSNAETGIELINDFQSYALVDRDISETTSFTLTLDTAIPVGQYGIYVESIQSSDTDNTKSSIAFYNGNTSVFVLDLDRNVEIYKSISLNSSITKIIFYASTGGGSSSGDTFSYNGFKLLQSSNLGKRFDKIESYIGNTKLEYFLNTASPVGSVQSITGEKAYAIDNYIYRADQIVFKSAGSAYDGIQYMIESPIIGKLITVSAKRNTGNNFLIRIINRNASNENISYSIVNGLDGVLSIIVPEGTARTLITIGACWGTAVGTDTVVTFSDIKIMYGNDEYVHGNWTYKGEKISIAESEKTNPCKSTLWKDFKGSEISGLANYSLHLNQSIAIFNDYMFLFNDGGTGVVLDYSTKNILSAISFEPSSRQHANSAQFTDYYYFDGDEFPLLLLSRCGNSASGSGDDECLVYRITRSGSTFTMTLVNSIRPNFATYGASWGIDTNTGLLYLSTYLNGTWQVSTNNPVVFVAFKMPSKTFVLNGTEILLSESDIVAKMFIDHYTLQGMAVDGGTIYTGITYNGQNVWAIDIWKNRITSKIYLQSNYECEGVAIYNGKIYVSQKNGADTTATNPCKVYELEF